MKNACNFIQALADACLFEYGPEAENEPDGKSYLKVHFETKMILVNF